MSDSIKITAVVAMDKNRVIGANGDLPWSLPDDLKLFKEHTINRPLIMGRKTYDSIGRALPDRTNIVLTRSPSFKIEGCLNAYSLDEALALAHEHLTDLNEIAIGGGAVVYDLFMPLLTHMVLTEVDCEVEGDTWFPEWDRNEWILEASHHHPADERHAYAFDINYYKRISSNR